MTVCFELGQRVQGTYLKQSFSGLVKGIDFLAAPDACRYTIVFDRPVVVAPALNATRTRVVMVLDGDGNSVNHKGLPDGIAEVVAA